MTTTAKGQGRRASQGPKNKSKFISNCSTEAPSTTDLLPELTYMQSEEDEADPWSSGHGARAPLEEPQAVSFSVSIQADQEAVSPSVSIEADQEAFTRLMLAQGTQGPSGERDDSSLAVDEDDDFDASSSSMSSGGEDNWVERDLEGIFGNANASASPNSSSGEEGHPEPWTSTVAEALPRRPQTTTTASDSAMFRAFRRAVQRQQGGRPGQGPALTRENIAIHEALCRANDGEFHGVVCEEVGRDSYDTKALVSFLARARAMPVVAQAAEHVSYDIACLIASFLEELPRSEGNVASVGSQDAMRARRVLGPRRTGPRGGDFRDEDETTISTPDGSAVGEDLASVLRSYPMPGEDDL